MNAPKVTIRDVARLAKVSPSLVSGILTGKARASEAVRQRVTVILQQAGYAPRHARRPVFFLMGASEMMLAEDQLRTLAGVQSLFSEVGGTLNLDFLPNKPPGNDWMQRRLENVAQRTPAGVMVSAGSPWYGMARVVFSSHRIPIVQVGYDIELPGSPAVVVDSFSGAYQAVRYLLSQGHRRIATIRWTAPDVHNAGRKHAGYVAALAEAGIPLDPRYVRCVQTYPAKPGWVLARDLLIDMLAQPEPPTALFVENSAISHSLLFPAPGDGGVVPDTVRQVDQVHFEDMPLDVFSDGMSLRLGYPERDTCMIAIDWTAIGRIAGRLMVDIIDGRASAESDVVRVGTLLQRVHGRNRTKLELPRGATLL